MAEHVIILDDSGHAVCRRPVSALPTSGLTSVAHDGTLTGSGATASPLSVVSAVLAQAITGSNLTFNATTGKIDGSAGGGTVVDATDTVKGIVELATNAEAVAGVSTTLAVTPAGVAAYYASKFADFSSLPICP